jgi:hypothetical protein
MLLGTWLLIAFTPLSAQTSREEVYATIEKSGGVYYAYPEASYTCTPAPADYEPFYISHYGRHGSRYLISDKDYLSVMKILDAADTAGVLSAIGRDVRRKLEIVWKDAEGLGGELTPLGVRQHREIAERMYNNYPEVFRNSRRISARSTVVVRCVLSMAAFCERLKELNPALDITRESGQRYMRYLNYWNEPAREFTSRKTGWYEIYERFREEHIRPERLMKLLFTDTSYVQLAVDAKELMMGLYWIASDMQNVAVDESLYDIFEPEELFDIWQIHNFKFYVCNGTSAWGKDVIMGTFKPLLRNILDAAEEAIQDRSTAATLRFGHDGNLAPLAGILELENCANIESDPDKFYQAWSDFKIAPMAGNIQLIFFAKPGADDVLVKFLLNEKEVRVPVKSDIAPYYHWKDLTEYYRSKL